MMNTYISPKTRGEPTIESLATGLGTLGRYGDNYMIHAAEGETVVPREILESNPGLKQDLFRQMQLAGIENPNRYVVGSELNSINPITGQPEFFFKKIFRAIKKVAKKAAPIIAPIVGNMILPGVGGLIASGLVTKMQGGSWADALKSAAMSYAGSSLMSGISGGIGAAGSGGSFGEGFMGGLEQGITAPWDAVSDLGGAFDQGILGSQARPVFGPKGDVWRPYSAEAGGQPIAGGQPVAASTPGAVPVSSGAGDLPASEAMGWDSGEILGAGEALMPTGMDTEYTDFMDAPPLEGIESTRLPRLQQARFTPEAPTARDMVIQSPDGSPVDSLSSGSLGDNYMRTVDFPDGPPAVQVSSGAGDLPAAEAMAWDSGEIVAADAPVTGTISDDFYDAPMTWAQDVAVAGSEGAHIDGKFVEGATYKDGSFDRYVNTGKGEIGIEVVKPGFGEQTIAQDILGEGGLDVGLTGVDAAKWATRLKYGIPAAGAGIYFAMQPGEEDPKPSPGSIEYEAYEEWRSIADKNSPEAIRLHRIWYGQPTYTRAEFEKIIGTGSEQFPDWRFVPAAAGGGEVMGPGSGTSDSIPARLSDGEFVMTARAVRNAGGGDRSLGAARMYDMMNRFERGAA